MSKIIKYFIYFIFYFYKICMYNVFIIYFNYQCILYVQRIYVFKNNSSDFVIEKKYFVFHNYFDYVGW